MRRLFWVALGAAAGVVIVRQLTKKAEALTPKGISRRVAGLGDRFKEFAEDVRAGMAEREQELTAALHEEEGAEPETFRQLMREEPDPGPGDRTTTGTGGGSVSGPDGSGRGGGRP